jgi:hypothetical protein
VTLQEIFRSMWEIQECVENYKQYPAEWKLIQLGEMDWREELHGQLSGILGKEKDRI